MERFVEPARFEEPRRTGGEPGFADVASDPLVRSRCHADHQANDTQLLEESEGLLPETLERVSAALWEVWPGD